MRHVAPVALLAALSLVVSGCATTRSATDIAGTAVTLNGTVNPEGKPTTAFFQWGASTTYGATTAQQAVGTGTADVPVSARVRGLRSGVTYHFRLCAQAASVQCGADRTFTTRAPGVQQEVAWQGLTVPTAVRFAPDGRVFIAEKSGIVKVFDSIADTTPTVFADLRAKVDPTADNGLLGLAIDPGFPAKPYVYVAYVTKPSVFCAGYQCQGYGGRIARLKADGDQAVSEDVLVQGGCFALQGHTTDHLEFGRDGALYASAGDGAAQSFTDYGQTGNVCGDPDQPAGTSLTPPTSEGGSLRAQDARTPGDPQTLDGTILRIDPATGDGLPDNPFASSPDPMARRIVAYGLRNPYRFTIRPETDELWIGDNGDDDWEELDRLEDPTAATPANFGWPCYEGAAPNVAFQTTGFDLCTSLYGTAGAATPPYFAYAHGSTVVPGDGCGTGSSSIGGPAFKPAGGDWPARYAGALFFADYARGCMWVMLAGTDGLPDPAKVELFRPATNGLIDATFGPDGNLYYASVRGTVYRLRYVTGNASPTAVARADHTSGAVPLTVQFDGSKSSDPDPGDSLTYAWDLDGDGQFDDSSAVAPQHTYATAGVVHAGLRVTDENGAIAEDDVEISAGNTPPTVTIDQPTALVKWHVGQELDFSGTATDDQDGTLPASAFSWELDLRHCADNNTCHTHILDTWDGVGSGSFVLPNHEYPAYLLLTVTVTDSGDLKSSQTIRLDPETHQLTLKTVPTGLTAVINAFSGPAPFTRTVIEGSSSDVSTPTPQGALAFGSWSDGGARSHPVTVTGGDATLTATFAAAP